MPDDLDTLGSLVSELQRTGEPVYGPWQAPFVDADGYLRAARDWLHAPSAQQVRRLPSEADLRALVDQLYPPDPANGPNADTVAAAFQFALEQGSDSALGVPVVELGTMSWPGRWTVLDRLASRGPTLDGATYLELLDEALRRLPNVDPKVPAAALVVLLERGGRTVSTGALPGWLRLAMLLTEMDPAGQIEVFGRLGVPPSEAVGALAVMGAEALEAGIGGSPQAPVDGGVPAAPDGVVPRQLRAAPAAAAAGAGAPIAAGVGVDWFAKLMQAVNAIDTNADTFLDALPSGPYFWARMGSAIHVAIAEFYRELHLAHLGSGPRVPRRLWTNSHPVLSILRSMSSAYGFSGKLLPLALAASRPDIFEFAFAHGMPPGWVYEIKPLAGGSGASLASYEATFYAFALTMANIPAVPGPPGAPGTFSPSPVPVPGGWVVFASPRPGVIVYQLRYASKQARARRKQPERETTATRLQIEEALRNSGQAAQVVQTGLLAAMLLALLEYGWVIAL